MKPPKNKELRWISVDLDSTLAHNTGYPDFKLLKPTKGAKGAMIKLSKKWKIIIYTARPWADYRLIETWLNKHKIPFKDIVCGKLLTAYYIDDRAIAYRGNWDEVLDEI